MDNGHSLILILLLFLQNCCIILALSIFWTSRYLSNQIDLPNMKELYASGTTVFLRAKYKNEKLFYYYG